MKKKKTMKEKVTAKSVKKSEILNSNWIVRITALVIIIPVVIVAVLLLTSIENSGEPVVGDRFDSHLKNKIADKDVKAVENALTYDNVDKVQVNLKSATLRILMDTNDSLNKDEIYAIAKDAYDKVTKLLPVETYFTNLPGENDTVIKMYDLEINVYNLIPDETNTTAQIYGVYYKNASSLEAGFDWITSPKNQDVVDSVMSDDIKE